MKIKDNIDLAVLENYGFAKITKEDHDDDDEYVFDGYDYKFEIGHSRRGQFYYLLVHSTSRQMTIYASKPDGSGGKVSCTDVFFKLIQDNIVEI